MDRNTEYIEIISQRIQLKAAIPFSTPINRSSRLQIPSILTKGQSSEYKYM